MFFIGIISEEKNEKYIKEMLKHNQFLGRQTIILWLWNSNDDVLQKN